MDRADALLDCLADGREHSGEALGQHLGVTRAAVWKLIRQLRKEGAPVRSGAGRGYCLAAPMERLNPETIQASLGASARGCLAEVRVERAVDSTNRRLFTRLDDLPMPCALLAEAQLAGRGRRGRPWHSPFGRNLYMSLAWRFEDVPGGMAGLSLVVGMAVAETLTRLGAEGIGLKWPNDLMVGDDKLGGVLVELQGEPAGPCTVVIGLGLNLEMDVAADIDQPWTALRHHMGSWPGRNRLAAALLDALVESLSRFAAEGFSPFADQWPRFDTLEGRRVTLYLGSQQLQGSACGVDATGCLLLDRGQGCEPWSAGEVSVRPVP